MPSNLGHQKVIKSADVATGRWEGRKAREVVAIHRQDPVQEATPNLIMLSNSNSDVEHATITTEKDRDSSELVTKLVDDYSTHTEVTSCDKFEGSVSRVL